jgi:hypothetical protein
MTTECNQATFEFHPLGRREVVGRFDGGAISSDGGGILLREVEVRTGILQQFAACFTDHRDADLIEHTADDLVAQRVYGLALGYEDLLDHDDLRHDPLLAALVGKGDPTGQDRLRERDRGKALAGKSTLNRLELTPAGASEESRYKKIVLHTDRADALFVDVFLQAPAAALLKPAEPSIVYKMLPAIGGVRAEGGCKRENDVFAPASKPLTRLWHPMPTPAPPNRGTPRADHTEIYSRGEKCGLRAASSRSDDQ